MDKHNVCRVTSEPSQSSSRRVSSFKDSSALEAVSKSCLMAELCFHRFVHLIVFRFIFSAFTTSSVLVIGRTSLL